MKTQFHLLGQRRFLPLFITQFLGAFNDNLFKSCLSVLIAYGLWSTQDWRPEILVSVAAGVFILPFVIFSPLAGEIADKYDKARLIKIYKIAELLVVICAVAGLFIQSIGFALFVLFAFGLQSTFFSPCKFAILPQHLGKKDLIAGNALVNTGTYLAILAGMMLGSLLGAGSAGLFVAALLLILCALAGLTASLSIPIAPAPRPDLKVSYNLPFQAVKIVAYAKKLGDGIFTSIIGSAWFFFIGALYLSQFPNYTSFALNADNTVLTFFMALFSIGVATGSLLNNRFLKGQVEATYVPLALAVIAAFSLDLYFASTPYTGQGLESFGAFIATPARWRIIFDLCAISTAAGFYIVPLKAIIQDRTPQGHTARVVACSSMMDAVFIFASALMAALLFVTGAKVIDLFAVTGVLSIVVALYLLKLLPEHSAFKNWLKRN